MEITNRAQLLEFIRKQSLKLIKENGALSTLEDKLEDIDDMYVQVLEKKLAGLSTDEERATEKEEYVELEKARKDKLQVLSKLISAYKYKTSILEKMHDQIKQELYKLGAEGSGVFKNKPINEFNNEDFQKGQTVKITTLSSETTLEKISDVNQYNILTTTAKGLNPGDILAIPNTKVGSPVKVTAYRKIGDKFQEIGQPTLQNIKAITKNPS